MTALFNLSPLVLSTLQNLSMVLDRSTTLSRGPGVAGLIVGRSEARAFGGLDMSINRTGHSTPAKVRYGAITVAPRAQGSAYSKSPGVHPVIDRAYDNPGVRFGDRVKGGERPVSAAGETSCHFSQTSVSKTSPIREMIKAARGGRRRTGSRAAAHVLYVEREGAPEQIKTRGEERLQGEAFTAEIERRGMDRSAVAQQAYIERAGVAEGIERKPGRTITDEELDALDEASFGTIGDTVEERTRFWLAVEGAEATPKGDRVTIKPRDNPEWWAKVTEAVDGAPSAAQRPIRDALARDDGEPFELKLPTDKAFAVHQWAVGLYTEAPLEISPGRGGRTQTRVIAELPHELDGRERLQIVRDFTQKLAEKGFPYWAVIHAPDANNDARNFHVHVAYYDRPAAKITAADGKEVWDFEIQEERRYPNRTKYLVRPHQQNRLRETNSQEWVTDLRKHWETVSNRVLEEAGVSKRYNLGTYESMGIDLEPLKHINSRTFNKERKGELTEEGPVLARRQWDVVHDRVVKEHEDRVKRRDQSITGLSDYAERLVRVRPHSEPRVKEIRRLKDLGIRASFQLAILELHQDLTRLVTDRVTSRPKLMLFAADKEDEKARKATKRGAATSASTDRPVAGADVFGLSRRSEVLSFLTTIYDRALRLDQEHMMRAKIARTNVQTITRELRSWASHPDRPLRGFRRSDEEAVQALDDPARTQRRAAAIKALEEGFRNAAERATPQILDSLKHQVGEPQPAATAQAPSIAKPSAMPEPEAPRYRPGRPDNEPRASERETTRTRPARPVLDPALVAAALGKRAATVPAFAKPQTSAPAPAPTQKSRADAPASNPREPTSSPSGPQQVPAKPIQGPTRPVREGARTPAETRSTPPRPQSPDISETAIATPKVRDPEAAQASAVQRSAIELGSATGLGSSNVQTAAQRDQVARETQNPNPSEVRPAPVSVQAPGQSLSFPTRAPAAASPKVLGSLHPTPSLDRATQPVRAPQAHAAARQVSGPAKPAVADQIRSPQAVPDSTPAPVRREPRPIPSLAAVMEGRDPRPTRTASQDELSKPRTPAVPEPKEVPGVPPAGQKHIELQDVTLKGVRRPEKKKRERQRDRDRGWER